MSVHHTFAVEAQQKLGGGNALEAVHILEEGIKRYPDYTTAYAILARAYMQMNDFESAFECVEKGLRRFPAHRALLMLDRDLGPHARLARTASTATNKVAEVAQSAVDTIDATINTQATDNIPEAAVGAVVQEPAKTASIEEARPEHLEVPTVHDESVASRVRAEQARPQAQPEIPTPDQALDDGLSNVDDDNDNWPELKELIDDADELTPIPPELEADESENDGAETQSVNTAPDKPVDTAVVLNQINVVDGNLVLDQSLVRRIRLGADTGNLRLIESAPSDPARPRALRSSNMRLVPGLEFTPLRVQSMRKNHVRMHYLPELPEYPVIRGSSMNISPPIAPPKDNARRKKVETEKKSARVAEPKRTQLEELAARLERARIPIVTEEPEVGTGIAPAPDAEEPMVISETMAGIYEKQGLYQQAIKAYRQLGRMKPERLEYFEQKIAELTQTEQR